MLRTRVRLGRTVNRSDRSHEYAVNLEGEIPFPVDDAEGVLEKVAELFHLAEEALAREIDRDNENGRECSPQPDTKGSPAPETAASRHRPVEPSSPRPEAATSKQVRYLLGLSKQKGLSRDNLDAIVTRVVGSARPKLDDLTKREAGSIIDHLNQLKPEATP